MLDLILSLFAPLDHFAGYDVAIADWLIYAYYAITAITAASAAASASDTSRKQANSVKDVERQRRADVAALPAEIQKPFDFAERGRNSRGNFPAKGVGFPGNTSQGSLGLPSNNMLGHTQLGQ